MSFNLKGANTPINVFHPAAQSYQANAEQILRSGLGLNMIRLSNGGEGNLWQTRITEQPLWAANFESLLNTVCKNGLKATFQCLSNNYGDFLDIREPHMSNPMPLEEALICIDKLAGSPTTSVYNGETLYGNSLGKNFFQDTRIPYWNICNEIDLENPSYLSWTLAVADRIKSYGGKVCVANGVFLTSGDWGTFNRQRQALGNYGVHVDYLQRHMYGIWELENYFTAHKGTGPEDLGVFQWEEWSAFMENQLRTELIEQRGDFPIDRLILGEFGIVRGFPAWDMVGLTNYYCDNDRRKYYEGMLRAIKAAGVVNAFFFTSFEENAYYDRTETDETHLSGRYGVIAANPYPPRFVSPAGTLLPGADTIASYFGGSIGPIPVFKCPFDGLEFGTQVELDTHIAAAHPTQPPAIYKCPYDGQTFDTQELLDQHLLTVHPAVEWLITITPQPDVAEWKITVKPSRVGGWL